MSNNITVKTADGIAIVTLKAADSKVNILNASMLSELKNTAEEISTQSQLKGVIVTSGQSAGFIAGADISEIENVTDPAKGAELATIGQEVFNLWENLPMPVIAAIHGHCMGGGTEFALACHYRVASCDTVIALPEVKLGILPGFGGTQRLPRLISLEHSLDIILSGRTVRSKQALNYGLVDRVANSDLLLEEATALLYQVLDDARAIQRARAKKSAGLRSLLLEKNRLGRAILFKQARQQLLKKTGGNYPAPIKALEVIEKTYGRNLASGLQIEATALGEMIVTSASKNLVHLYHLSQRAKKLSTDPGRTVQTAAVIGAGVMGGSIAHLLASHGITTILKDIDQRALDAGIDHARSLFEKSLKRSGADVSSLGKKMRLLNPTLDYTAFDSVDLVIEAIVEKMAIKKTVFKETEQHISEHAILASNTSALSISELQQDSRRPAQIGGLHFFNPVEKMPLVEVIRGGASSDQTISTLIGLATTLGKTPIVTSDSPGFLVNRLLVTYLLEAVIIAAEGVNWLSIDRMLCEFGYPMGPFRLIDEVGLDIAVEVGHTLCAAFPYLQKNTLLEELLSTGLLGKKGQSGFYNYVNGRSEGVNLGLEKLLANSDRQAGRTELKRLLYLMVNEAARCLEEHVVAAPEDIDTGMVFGTGFPPFQGGLCRWADTIGLTEICTTLKALASQHGDRFRPCDYLLQRKRFY